MFTFRCTFFVLEPKSFSIFIFKGAVPQFGNELSLSFYTEPREKIDIIFIISTHSYKLSVKDLLEQNERKLVFMYTIILLRLIACIDYRNGGQRMQYIRMPSLVVCLFMALCNCLYFCSSCIPQDDYLTLEYDVVSRIHMFCIEVNTQMSTRTLLISIFSPD